MKVLMVSTDAKILEQASAVRARMIWYASVLGRLDILLITKSAIGGPVKISDKVTVYPRRYRQAFGFVVPEGVEIISAQDPFENGVVGWWLAKKFKLPLQLQIHTDLFSPYFSCESVKNRIRLMLARFLLPKAQAVRVVSQKIKDGLKTQNINIKSEPLVLPIWTDIMAIADKPIKYNLRERYPQFGKIVLMASRLTVEKNIHLAIQAFAAVVKEHPEAGLVIAGDGPMHRVLAKEVERLDLAGRVVFAGWSDDLISLYKTADLFVNTSWYEGYGLTVIEAMAAGCPVVSTDVGVAREAGATIADWSADDLASKINIALKDQLKPRLPNSFNLNQEDYLRRHSEQWNFLVDNHKEA